MNCLNCGKEILKTRKYCDNKCKNNFLHSIHHLWNWYKTIINQNEHVLQYENYFYCKNWQNKQYCIEKHIANGAFSALKFDFVIAFPIKSDIIYNGVKF